MRQISRKFFAVLILVLILPSLSLSGCGSSKTNPAETSAVLTSTPTPISSATQTPVPTAPTVTSAETDGTGTMITLTFDKTMVGDNVANNLSDFKFTDNGNVRNFDSIDVAELGDHEKHFQLYNLRFTGSAIAYGDTITLSYTGNDVRSKYDGGILANFTNMAITNNVRMYILGGWNTASSMPLARTGAAAGVINSILYVAGGSNATETYTLQAYSSITDTWSTLAPMPAGRYQGDGAAVIDGKLYVPGGWDNTYSKLPHNDLFIYDPATNLWSRGASMSHLSADGACGVIDGKLYVTTASDGSPGCRNFLDVYDPTMNSWSVLVPSPVAHESPAFGVIDNKFYVAGGYDGSALTNELDVYDPVTNTWNIKAPMPFAGNGFASAVMNGQLWVIGGVDAGNTFYNTVYVYNPSTDTWATATEMPMPTPRALAVAGVITKDTLRKDALSDMFYVAGGNNGTGILATNEEFFPNVLIRFRD